MGSLKKAVATYVATAFIWSKVCLGFAKDVVWDSVGTARNARFDDSAEVLLVLLDVVGKGIQQTLGMNGVHDDT